MLWEHAPQSRHVGPEHEINIPTVAAGGDAGHRDERQQKSIEDEDRRANSGLEAPRLSHDEEGREVCDSDGLQCAAQLNQVRMFETDRLTQRTQEKENEEASQHAHKDLVMSLRERPLGIGEGQRHARHQHERWPDQIVES